MIGFETVPVGRSLVPPGSGSTGRNRDAIPLLFGVVVGVKCCS
jgi:hypothetical protein